MITETLTPSTARSSLEIKYAPLISDQLEFGKHVTYVPNKKKPIFGWFKYKEAFSRNLVEEILTKYWSLPTNALIFDPFAGCGTTLLASKQLGFSAIGLDIMPIALFITRVKLHEYEDFDLLREASESLLAKEFVPTDVSWPDVRIVNLAFDRGTQDEIVFFREEILKETVSEVRDFLMLALLSSLEDASYTAKDGQFLRIIKRHPKRIREVLSIKLERMLQDIRFIKDLETTQRPSPNISIFPGDIRNPPPEVLTSEGQVSAVLTSPPYLNRYDYSRTYALELCLMYDERGNPCVSDFEDLKNIRHSLLRSHIESRPAPTDTVKSTALDEILDALKPKHLNNARIPIMIKGYFEDMNLAIQNIAKMLAPGGKVALVIANARFEGELIPVDLILSEIAAAHGLKTEALWVTRYKGNSSQQMGKYGRVPVRESVVFWQKEG